MNLTFLKIYKDMILWKANYIIVLLNLNNGTISNNTKVIIKKI